VNYKLRWHTTSPSLHPHHHDEKCRKKSRIEKIGTDIHKGKKRRVAKIEHDEKKNETPLHSQPICLRAWAWLCTLFAGPGCGGPKGRGCRRNAMAPAGGSGDPGGERGNNGIPYIADIGIVSSLPAPRDGGVDRVERLQMGFG